MYTLIYLSFGSFIRIQAELIYSIISFYKSASTWSKENIQIVIYTDLEIVLPSFLDEYKIRIRYMKKRNVEDWINRSNGHHFILKARVLQDYLAYSSGGVILVDTDTFFIEDIRHLFEEIEKGNFVMHLKEQTLLHRPMITAFFDHKSIKLLDGSEFKISMETEMWNSGVLGLNSSYSSVVDEAVHLIEQISNTNEWPQSEFHIIEQFSFCCLFQNKQCILPSEKFILHYWFFKSFRYLLANHFNYFHDNDFKEFLEIIKMHNVDEKYLSRNFLYINIPFLLVELMDRYIGETEISNDLLPLLPSDTYIGSILRKLYTK